MSFGTLKDRSLQINFKLIVKHQKTRLSKHFKALSVAVSRPSNRPYS